MWVLALDISTKTGWSLIHKEEGQDEQVSIGHYGRLVAEKSVDEWGEYPFNYLKLADHMAKRICELVQEHSPDFIVIEETNKGKNRYTQKMLEFIHCKLLDRLADTKYANTVNYVNTSDWRKSLGIYMTKEDKKNNAKVNKAKRQGKSKKELGLKGKITRKHIAVRLVNDKYGTNFKQKDNDTAEAICIGLAFCNDIPVCDGKK